MKAAVTGGTGFLGQPLLRLLADQAEEVRALVRRPADDERIRALGAEPIRGDLNQPGELVQPGDTVFHAAARVDTAGKWPVFYDAIVGGTQRLLEHALDRGAERFVYISTAAVYDPRVAAGTPASAEQTPVGPPDYNYYGRAKLEAEQLVRDACEKAGCAWSILRFGFLYGPGNRTAVHHFARFLERKRVMIIGPGDNRLITVYVEDAARAIIRVGQAPEAAGRIYDIAGDEAITQQQYLNAMADVLGQPHPTGRVSRRMAYMAATVADQVAKLPSCEPPLSRAVVTLMSTDQILDDRRIREELGWKPEVSFAEGMERMRLWYENEYLTEQRVAGTGTSS